MSEERSRMDEGRLQATAAAHLLQKSRLVQWHQTDAVFAAEDWQIFEGYWRTIDPFFGRVICWITFSAGAELLLKGVCLANDVEIRQPPNSDGTRFFGAIGKLWQGPQKPPLQCLFEKKGASTDQQGTVLDTYKHLTKMIRNRDAHGYLPKVRNKDFSQVFERFVPCFNLLMSWIPGDLMSDEELAVILSNAD